MPSGNASSVQSRTRRAVHFCRRLVGGFQRVGCVPATLSANIFARRLRSIFYRDE